MLFLLGKVPDTVIAGEYGITKDSVQRKRTERGIPTWSEATPLAAPHHRRVEELLQRWGVRHADRHAARPRKPLPTGRRYRRWSKQAVARLGKEPDSQIAADLGITRGAVQHRRQMLEISAYRRHSDWSAEEVAQLGTASDREVARRLGRTLAAVVLKRRGLGIAPYRGT